MPLNTAELLPPVTPSKIICVGRNYRDHAKELGNEVPTEPLLFFKPPSSLLAPGAQVVLSGLLHSQAQTALMAYRAQGLVLQRRIPLDEWTTLVLRRPALPR